MSACFEVASPTPVSWLAATWTVPSVPALSILVFVLVVDSTPGGDDQSSGYAWGLGLALALAGVGAVLSRVGGPSSRGVGVGLVAGAIACAVASAVASAVTMLT